VAAAIVACGLAYWSMPSTDPEPAAPQAALAPAPPTSAPPAVTTTVPGAGVGSSPPPLAALPVPPPSPAARSRSRAAAIPDGDLTPDIADFVNKGERPTMAEVIERLHQAGVHGGLGAFSPPGTRPPLVGLAVPEDFELPPGYVRHYQATDDGKRIEPILMFSPDYQPLDAAGRPIAIPKDRVVPPELAPPGLPVRRIAIPAPTEPGRPGN
jgi:hypothetical protein